MVDDFQRNKKFLRRYKLVKAHIDQLEEKLFELDTKTISSAKLSAMPKGSSMANFNRDLEYKEETENRIQELLKKSRIIRIEIYQALDNLPDSKQAHVLELFFIENLTFESIANKTNYSLRWVEQLYSAGVRNIIIST